MLCRKCGKDIPSGSKYCNFCGTCQEVKKAVKRRGNGQGTVYRKGKGWTARVCIGWKLGEDGKPKAVRVTKGGYKTKAEALAACPALLEGRRIAAPNTTFEGIYNEWRTEYEPRIVHSTMLCYQAAYKHFKPLHYRRFSDILAGDLQDCIDNCGQGKRTKENMKAFASLLYKYAMQNELVQRNRAETLYTGEDTKVSRPAFTDDEFKLIQLAVPFEPYASYVVCMCYLGFRPGELLALKKDAYIPSENCLIGGSKTKAGIDRPVPISPKIAPILRQRMAFDSDYLFPRLKDGKKMNDNYFRKYCFDPLMEHLGIKNRVPYSCRHTFANLLKKVQGSDTDKAALMGHSDASMTKYYQDADYESLRKITDAI